MWRDLTMIFAVLVSVVSLGFGVYKNIEAGNAKGFAYEQAYRILGIVDDANITSAEKANIKDAALGTLGTPPPVIDLSRSSADAPVDPGECTATQKSVCLRMAGDMAELNAECLSPESNAVACSQADLLKADITAQSCIYCFSN